jgi:uncharacterized membrane protein
MDRKILTKLLLILIILGGLSLRVIGSSNPRLPLNWDEAALGYNSYSILLTGRDEYGKLFPLTLRSFDDYKPALYSYLTTVPIKFIGLNEVAIRTTSIISGLIVVLLGYVIAKTILKSSMVALLTSLALATEPWSIFYSRGAWESNLSLALILASLGLILRKRRLAGLLIAALSTFAYHSPKVYFFFITLWVIRQSNFKQKIYSVLLFGVITSIIISTGGIQRFTSSGITSVLKNSSSPYVWSYEIGQRYLAYFSPANLFVRGTNENNQKIPGFAEFYVWEFVFWIIGVGYLISNWSKYKTFTLALLIAPIPAVLTWSWFNPVRVLPLMFAHSMLISVGIYQAFCFLKGLTKLLVVMGTVAWSLLSVGWLILAIIWQLPYFNYGDWQWGFRETIKKIQPYYSKVDKIVWETPQAQPYIFSLFYSKFPPSIYHNWSATIPSPRKIYDYDKIEFRKIYWPDDNDEKNTLFVGGVYSLPEEKSVDKIIDPQGYEMYRIVINQ